MARRARPEPTLRETPPTAIRAPWPCVCGHEGWVHDFAYSHSGVAGWSHCTVDPSGHCNKMVALTTKQREQKSSTLLSNASKPDRWRFTLPILPPSQNHATMPNGHGGRYMTENARSARDAFTLAARGAGFKPNLKGKYAVRLDFTMPDWKRDLDGPIKAALDAMFEGGRYDHRIVWLQVTKSVERGKSATEVEIEEVP